MNRFFKNLLYIVLILNSTILVAQSKQLTEVDRVDMNSGLTHNGVTSLYQDSRGYLWVGTSDGLNCYNGFGVHTYQNSVVEREFPTNRITTIAEDNSGKLWIGTDNGVVIYDYDLESFRTINTSDIKSVTGQISVLKLYFLEDRDAVLMFTEHDGVIEYDLNSETLLHHPTAIPIQFNDALMLDSETFLISIANSALVFNLKDFSYSETLINMLFRSNTLAKLNNSTLLVGTDFGLAKIGYSINSFGKYSFYQIGERLLQNLQITALLVDNSNGTWIGTRDKGLRYTQDLSISNHFNYSDFSNATITSFSQLKDGTVWVGTSEVGMIKYSLNDDIFKGFSPPYMKYPKISLYANNSVMVKSSENAYYSISLLSGEYKNLFPGKFRLGGSYMFIDSKNMHWIFAHKKLFIGDPESEEEEVTLVAEAYDYPIPRIAPNIVCEDKNGDLWAGYRGELLRISLDENSELLSVESISENKFFDKKVVSDIVAIYPDYLTGKIMVGSSAQGLMVIDCDKNSSLKDAKIEQYLYNPNEKHSLSSNFVSAIFRDRSAVLWIGTQQGGVCRLLNNSGEMRFEIISKEDGLVNNVISSITDDKDGNLWIATNNGLCRYDPQNHIFSNYNHKSGLPFEVFTDGVVVSKNGIICLAGINGVCYFDPASLPSTEPIPTLSFRGFSVNNKVIEPNKEFNGRVVIKKRVEDGDEIVLKENENIFSFDVDILSTNQSSTPLLYYRLKPISEQWSTIPATSQSLSFSTLPPAKYKLELRTANSLGQKSSISTIDIVIKPPFRRSPTAICLYIILVAVAIYLVFRTIIRIQRLRFNLTLEESRKRNLIELNEEKQRYFSNINHELKTPLTLIMAPLSILSERFKFDIEVKKNLQIMERQSAKMLQLIDLAHALQLNDANLLKLKPSQFYFKEFVNDVTKDFSFMANFDNKKFEIHHPQTTIKVNGDYDRLEKVLNNLLNNAFKHTKPHDYIALSYSNQNGKLLIEVSDNGNGISEKDIPHIFDRFYKAKNSNTENIGGTGIGLSFTKRIVELHNGSIEVKSKLNEGSTFSITLPILIDEREVEHQIEEVVDESDMVIGEATCSYNEHDNALSSSLIYIVEDNSEMRGFLEQLLGRFFVIESFPSGVECIKRVSEQWPDLILSDLMMPDMDGEELCTKIKSEILTSHIPVILLTACNTVDDRIKGLQIKADNYIGKPFYPNHLIASIENLLHNRAMMRERFSTGVPFQKSLAGGISAKDGEFLEQLYKIFNENLDNEELNLDTIPLDLGLNRSSFFAKVKALTGDSPYELLKNYRLQSAATLLEGGEYNVQEVCSMTGFKSRTHFSRLFKEKFEVTPSSYISSKKEK